MSDGQKFDAVMRDLARFSDNAQEARSRLFSDLREFQLGARILLDHEARRLERKLGAEHPRVKLLRRKSAELVKVALALEVQAEIARIRVPAVEENDTLLQGRITDTELRGVPNAGVRLVDEQGQEVGGVSEVKTDASGHYAFVLKPEVTAGLANKKVSVVVVMGKDKVLPATRGTVTVQPKARLSCEARLSVSELETLKLRVSIKRPPR